MRKARFGAYRLVTAVAVIALLALALVAARAEANPQAATISFVGNATLVTGGVIVTLHYSCLPPSPGFIAVDLDENGLPGGTTTEAICDGQNHSVTVTVEGLFTPGTAAGRADVTNGSGGAMATTNQAVPIK